MVLGRYFATLARMRKPYPTDLSDAEWKYIEPHLPAPKGHGRPRTHSLREILNAIFYLLPGHFTYEQLNCTASICLVLPAPVDATVLYNDDTKTAVLNPTAPLASNTEYTAVVEGTGDGDMKAVKDRGGTPMASDYIFYFTTSGGNPTPF